MMAEPEKGNDKVRTFDVILLGDSTVGKTSIFMRFSGKEFGSQPTPGLETIRRAYKTSSGGSVIIQLHDTAGMERMRTITPSYYRRTHAAILVYVVDNDGSYRNLKEWESEPRVHESKTAQVYRYLVGNKVDLDEDSRVDDKLQGDIEHFCKDCDVDRVFKTSAKTGIEEVFQHIADRLAVTARRRWSTARTDDVNLGLQTHTYVTALSSSCSC